MDDSVKKMENSSGCALQIIKTGDESDNYSFNLIEENLKMIIDKVPSGMLVSTVSVVGAFRTGKSFLLTFFVKYLQSRSCNSDEQNDDKFCEWLKSAGEKLDGNSNISPENKEDATNTVQTKSFQWRGGQERTTTGIWMWSEPFFLKIEGNVEIAVLLIDTQGLFDNLTTMGLTACIFGLSTLMSSYQIYNVEKRIQEDNLQHLALFSEYGRIALLADSHGSDDEKNEESSNSSELKKQKSFVLKSPHKPFQVLEFLIRDFQNFDSEDLDNFENTNTIPESTLRMMSGYLDSVISSKAHKDLQETREQIIRCFGDIRAFMLPHPGFNVIRKTYDGSIDKIEHSFLKMLNYYVKQVFSKKLEPKKIHGNYLTGPELFEYIRTYVALFKSGAQFPEAKTMLEATAEANNRNALTLSFESYKKAMDGAVGPKSSKFLNAHDFQLHHIACKEGAERIFDARANMGRQSSIDAFKAQLIENIAQEMERYRALNASKNPFQNFEVYGVPLVIAAFAFVFRWIADSTCSGWSDVCSAASDGLGHLYVAIFFFILITSFSKLVLLFDYLKGIIPLFLPKTPLTEKRS